MMRSSIAPLAVVVVTVLFALLSQVPVRTSALPLPASIPDCGTWTTQNECQKHYDVAVIKCAWCDHRPSDNGTTSPTSPGVCGFEDPCDSTLVVFTDFKPGEGFVSPCFANFSHPYTDESKRSDDCDTRHAEQTGFYVMGIMFVVILCLIVFCGIVVFLKRRCCDN